MGVLGDPHNHSILRAPKVQNQQFHYSSLLNYGGDDNEAYNTKYVIPSFKNIGRNDPVVNQQQIFYSNTQNPNSDNFFSGGNPMRESLGNINPAFPNNISLGNLDPGSTPNADEKNPAYDLFTQAKPFRGSFCQKQSNTPDTPVFKSSNKRASNLRRILEKRDFDEMEGKKKAADSATKGQMLDPRSHVKKKSRSTYLNAMFLKNPVSLVFTLKQKVESPSAGATAKSRSA